MNELAELRTFVAVVENGSFSKTARQTGRSTSSIARQVSALEDRLGISLLHRTTRQQGLTDGGAAFYEGAIKVLSSLDNLQRDVSAYQSELKGVLRAQIRASAALSIIAPELPRFLEQYPDIKLNLVLADEQVDLVANGLDVAVWLGHLNDSGLIARRLSANKRILCGSPAYFERYGEPKHPSDLQQHNCLLYRAVNYGNLWRFEKGDEKLEVHVAGNLESENGSILLTSCINGVGLFVAQEWMLRGPVRDGRLRPVLTDYIINPSNDNDTALHVVWPPTKKLSPKARAFIDFLVSLF
ncbi:LysR family transcriptional regulator [Sphingobium phenoxybenzoativorans]|uniref:LysR family transcriptional regulator n=1 Tax=Sphingobium phenoxybenzoativorans TaxID=1592790 RepID=A0A975KAJ7_9SPHN|nr:LysR family transcriptional regulator [Sphingobium phenoxybenzoativorans]QUT07820.1 LysR family transcriptional regulator [Sphingobium phenoxybenzoativorans]